jgi:hypothetical protein
MYRQIQVGLLAAGIAPDLHLAIGSRMVSVLESVVTGVTPVLSFFSFEHSSRTHNCGESGMKSRTPGRTRVLFFNYVRGYFRFPSFSVVIRQLWIVTAFVYGSGIAVVFSGINWGVCVRRLERKERYRPS